MRRVKLPRATAPNPAEQCRELGLRVSDRIIGRETYSNGAWSEARLTLLYCGTTEAVWNVETRGSRGVSGTFCQSQEEACWNLDTRQWYKLEPSKPRARKVKV